MEIEHIIYTAKGYVLREIIVNDDIRMTPKKKLSWSENLVAIREITPDNKGRKVPRR